jgi:hypothetical protein
MPATRQGRIPSILLPNEETTLTVTGEYVDINESRFATYPFGDGLVKGAPQV